jgi:sigma-70-like protein
MILQAKELPPFMSIFRRAPPIDLEFSLFGDVIDVAAEGHRQNPADEVSEQFERLRTPVYAYVLAVCGRAGEAEELTQEVFLRLYSYLRAGNRVRSTRAWVFRVAHNWRSTR